MSESTAIILINKASLDKINSAKIQEIKNEIKDVRKEIKKQESNIETGIKLANPNYTIDEIRRNHSLPKHLRTQNRDSVIQEAGYLLADESIKKKNILEEYKDMLQFQLIFRKKEMSIKNAYKLIRHEAEKVGIKMPRRISAEETKKAYRKMALLYAPHNYDVYRDIIKITPGESNEKFNYIVNDVREAYELIIKHYIKK